MNSLKMQYDMIAKNLLKLDFNELWPDFKMYPFALYTEKEACIQGECVSKPVCFKGNTAIIWEEQYIAIWNVDSEERNEIDFQIEKIVHEMFHAFQLEKQERRFANEMKMLAHPYDLDELLYKNMENEVLIQAYKTKERKRKKSLLAHFCELRNFRNQKKPKKVQYENLIETIEGTAVYIEVMVLKQLSEQHFKKKIRAAIRVLETSLSLLDIRYVSYYSGLILLLTAEEIGICIQHKIGEEKRSIFELISDHLQNSDENVLRQEYQKKEDKKKRKIEQIIKQGEFYSGQYQICGFDPMNMFQIDDKIYGKNFWSLWDLDKQEMMEISGESVLLRGNKNNIKENQRIIAGNAQFTGFAAGRGVGFTT